MKKAPLKAKPATDPEAKAEAKTTRAIPALPGGIHVAPIVDAPGFTLCPHGCEQLVLRGITPEGSTVWLTPVFGEAHTCPSGSLP